MPHKAAYRPALRVFRAFPVQLAPPNLLMISLTWPRRGIGLTSNMMPA